MASVEYYGYSNCTSCKKAEKAIDASGLDASKRDLFKQKLDSTEIRELFSRAGLTPGAVLSTRSRPYADLGLADRTLSDDEIIDLMAEYPALLRRPIVLRDGKALVGFNQGSLEALLA